LKDLGKKWSTFSKFEIENLKILEKLNVITKEIVKRLTPSIN